MMNPHLVAAVTNTVRRRTWRCPSCRRKQVGALPSRGRRLTCKFCGHVFDAEELKKQS